MLNIAGPEYDFGHVQAAALLPGLSRSGSTITTALCVMFCRKIGQASRNRLSVRSIVCIWSVGFVGPATRFTAADRHKPELAAHWRERRASDLARAGLVQETT